MIYSDLLSQSKSPGMRPFLFIFLFTWFFNLFLPWWAALLPAIAIGAWLMQRTLQAFTTGLLAGGLAWFIQSLYIHIANQGVLSGRIADMLQLGSPWLLLVVMFLIGGVLIGTGTLFGFQLKKLLSRAESGERQPS